MQEPGPEPQWSADGQWWWDGHAWTQMWHAPRGLAWSGDSWVRAAEEAPPPAAASVQLHAVPAPPPPAPVAPPKPPPAPEPAPVRQPAAAPVRQPAAAPVRQPVAVPPPAVAIRPPHEVVPRQGLAVSAPPARRGGPGSRTTWLVAAATVLVLVGTSSVILATMLSRPGGQTPNQLSPGQQNPGHIAAALVGRKFTRDVVPPELADAAPLRDVFVPGSVPGLVGQLSTTTSDLGGTVTFYVFADQVWAEAFYETPPTAYGCGVCTSMDSATDVSGVGDKARSYVLYRKTLNGKSWIATTTYTLRGSVVIDGLYFPVNVSGPSPSLTDLAVPGAYDKAAIQLLNRI